MRNDKGYYELLCKNYLCHFWPEKYSSLIKHECPDWISDTVGVEVRRAMEDDSGEFDAFVKRYLGKPLDENGVKRLRKFGFDVAEILLKNNTSLTLRSETCGTIILFLPKNEKSYLLAGGVGKSDYISNFTDYIISALEDKLNLLNDHYDLRKENNVFLIIEEQLNYLAVDSALVGQLAESIVEKIRATYCSGNYRFLFNRVYLLFYDNLIDISTEDWTWSRNVIDHTLFNAICASSSVKQN